MTNSPGLTSNSSQIPAHSPSRSVARDCKTVATTISPTSFLRMRHPILFILLLPFLIGYSQATPAAEEIKVKMSNGDNLSGSFEGFQDRTVGLKTVYAGSLKLSLADVAEMACEETVFVTLQDGSSFKTTLKKITGGCVHLADEQKIYTLSFDQIRDIHSLSLEDLRRKEAPELRPGRIQGLSEFKEKRWEGGLAFGYTLNRSTTSSDDLYLRFRSTYTKDVHKMGISAHSLYGMQDRLTSKKEFFGMVRYDNKLKNNLYAFGQFSAEYDQIERLDLRHAFRSGIEAVWSAGDRQLEDALAEGRSRMTAATVDKMRLYGCAGTAPSRSAS